MYELSAFAFTPAAIISEANVCRHSCRLIGSSAFQAVSARRERARASNGVSAAGFLLALILLGAVGVPRRARGADGAPDHRLLS
jgi:hypothetical protein